MKKKEYRGTRRQARELAVKMLYSLAETGQDMSLISEDFWKNFSFRDDVLGEAVEPEEAETPGDVRLFASMLAQGVAEHLALIDRTIAEQSTNWSIERMAKVDLSILRMGTFELLHASDIPVNVAINEAIEIAKRFGTKESPSFVNGILDKVSKTARTEG